MGHNFHDFSPTVCHRHTITLVQAGQSGMNPSGGKRFSISATCLDQPWGPLRCVYSGKWRTFLGVQQSGLDLITHPKLVLVLRIIIAIPLLLLWATIGMIWSDLYHVHMCV